ncbi:uncharacterized protein LOC126757488 [Bactrocera neohumeralis]|uniref:uncharacterized protein LOC126757488 n=1 Tax=Bactrocera neohumeralis TaxID=98809 RepID=UPI0021653F35|nr:uncharacterized protein LOC126757488 [Bactrocera neohumeralis]
MRRVLKHENKSNKSSAYASGGRNVTFLIVLTTLSQSEASVVRLLTETLQNNVAGEPITHVRTEWDFDPEVSQKRRALFYETHGYRAAKFIERIGLGIDGHEEERRAEQRARDVGRLNGEHNINFPPEPQPQYA